MNKNKRKNQQRVLRIKTAKQISQKLHQARIKRGDSIADLHRITKIRERYLEDLDSGRFHDLPDGFYVRAFIKKYADSVGLDGSELLKNFRGGVPDPHDPRYVKQISNNQLLRKVNQNRVANRKLNFRRSVPITATIVVIVVILIGIWLFAGYHSTSQPKTSHNSVSMSGSSSLKTKKVSHHHSQKQVRKRSAVKKHRSRSKLKITKKTIAGKSAYLISTKAKPKLQLVSSSKAWTSVKSAGRSLFESSLGDRKIHVVNLPNKAKQVVISLGNAPKTKIKVNGHLLKFNSKQQVQSFILKFK